MRKYLLILIVFSSIQLSAQKVAVTSKMTNFLYQWVDNPLRIVVENTPCNYIVVKAEQGHISGNNCDFIYTVSNDSIRYDYIKVGVKTKGDIKWISNDKYFVRKLPDPIAMFANRTNGDTLARNLIRAQFGLSLPYFDFVCGFNNENIQKITSYRVTIKRDNKIVFIEDVNSNLFTEHFKQFIEEKSMKNDSILFDNLKALLYEKEKRELTQTIHLVVSN